MEPAPRRVIEAVAEGWVADSSHYGDDAPADRPWPERVQWTLRFDDAHPFQVALGLHGSDDVWTFDRSMLSAALASDAPGETYYGEGDVRIGLVKWGIAFELRGHDAPPRLGVIPHAPATWFHDRINAIAPPDVVSVDVDALIAELQGES